MGRKRRANSRSDSDTSDSEYATADDDFIDDDDVEEEEEGWAKAAERRGQKRPAPSSASSGSESSASYDDDDDEGDDDDISEEELRDLGVVGCAGRRDDGEKGKEREADDLGTKKTCGICLSDEQEGATQGVLDCCSHYYCFACIMEWSKVESRCPSCKRRFVTITRSSSSSSRWDLGFGFRRTVVRVAERDQVYESSEEEEEAQGHENVVCTECQQEGDDNLMLLCDTCDSPAHTYCVGLGREVPEGNWYCESCSCTGEGPSSSPQALQDPAAAAPAVQDEEAGETSLRGVEGDDQEATTSQAAAGGGGGGASTVSGRREIQRRIRLLRSNSRNGAHVL